MVLGSEDGGLVFGKVADLYLFLSRQDYSAHLGQFHPFDFLWFRG